MTTGDLGLGIMFAVGVSGMRNLFLLGGAIKAVGKASIESAINMDMLRYGMTKLVVGAALVVVAFKGIKDAIDLAEEASEFDYQMRHLGALGQQYGEDMSGLRGEILDLSIQYGLSAVDIAEANKELIRAGYAPSEAMEMSGGIASLARIGEMSQSEASETILAIINSMKLLPSEVDRLVDTVAYASNQGWADPSAFMAGFARFGATGYTMNQSPETLMSMFLLLKSQGLSDAKAGMQVRMLLSRILAPSAASAKLLDDMNINTHDSDGNFLNIFDILGDIRAGIAAGRGTEADFMEAFTDEELQAFYRQQGQDATTIFSQRPVVAYHIISSAEQDGLLGADVGKALADRIQADSGGYGAAYLAELQDSYTYQKDQLIATWEAIKIQVGIPLLKILSSLLTKFKPLLKNLFDFLSANEGFTEGLAKLMLVLPLATGVAGLVIAIQGLKIVWTAIKGVEGLNAALALLKTGQVVDAAAKTAWYTKLPVILLAKIALVIAALVLIFYIVKGWFDVIALDMESLGANARRLLANFFIFFLNVLVEPIRLSLASLGTLVMGIGFLIEKISSLLPTVEGTWFQDRVGMTMSETFDELYGGMSFGENGGGFLQGFGFNSYEIDSDRMAANAMPEGITPILDDAYFSRLLSEASGNGTSGETPSESPANPLKTESAGTGVHIGSLHINITSDSDDPEAVGQTIADAIERKLRRVL